jgi:alkanesulfonate monooxygenase SsuD/methylene tetrahydromethanopterin reductase-like flavin-dependent oxidoreductase (luciferase family)
MSYGINACMLLGDTDEDAEARADDHLDQVRRDPSLTVGASGIGAALIGSPKRVLERIRRYEEIGVGLIMLQLYPMRQGLDEFAEKILPELSRDRTAPAGALASA